MTLLQERVHRSDGFIKLLQDPDLAITETHTTEKKIQDVEFYDTTALSTTTARRTEDSAYGLDATQSVVAKHTAKSG